MEIGLYDVDSKIPNLVLMKLSAWHKKEGDDTELYMPLKKYDRVYASKVFDKSAALYFYDEIGGSGTGDWETVLPEEVEHIMPDYSLYSSDYAMGFTTRGCIRNCPFCIVRRKEGLIHPVADIYEFWGGQKKLMLLDNNILALPKHFIRIAKQIIKEKIIIDFNQGLDIRLVNDANASYLAKMNHLKQIRFAFDNVAIEPAVRKGIKILGDAGIKPYRLMFYVLIGFDSTPEEDLHRVELLRSLKADPFVMPFDKKDDYQRKFSRWVNHKAIFKSVSWDKYGASPTRKSEKEAD